MWVCLCVSARSLNNTLQMIMASMFEWTRPRNRAWHYVRTSHNAYDYRYVYQYLHWTRMQWLIRTGAHNYRRRTHRKRPIRKCSESCLPMFTCLRHVTLIREHSTDCLVKFSQIFVVAGEVVLKIECVYASGVCNLIPAIDILISRYQPIACIRGSCADQQQTIKRRCARDHALHIHWAVWCLVDD